MRQILTHQYSDPPVIYLRVVCESIQVEYNTVKTDWLPKSRKLSPKVKEVVNSQPYFTEEHARAIMKYSHTVQNRLTKTRKRSQKVKQLCVESTKEGYIGITFTDGHALGITGNTSEGEEADRRRYCMQYLHR